MARLQGDWKDVLQAQRAELDQLEAMDSELNDDKISAEIDKALKKTSRVGAYSSATLRTTLQQRQQDDDGIRADDARDDDDDDDDLQYRRRAPAPSSRASSAPHTGRRDVRAGSAGPVDVDAVRSPLSARGAPGRAAGGGPGGDNIMDLVDDGEGGAPDTAARYQKARLKMLSKQLEVRAWWRARGASYRDVPLLLSLS